MYIKVAKVFLKCLLNNRSVSKFHGAKLFTENSAMARLQDILRGWGSADPRNILKRGSFHPELRHEMFQVASNKKVFLKRHVHFN